MLESGLFGSVRGAPSDGRPYRDSRPEAELRCAAKRTPQRLGSAADSEAGDCPLGNQVER